MRIYDTIEIDDAANVRILADGRIAAYPRIARTGIQLYAGDELGKPEMKVVRVYRSEKEVFDKASMSSFLHKPLTNDHPPEPVTPENFTKYARGWTGDEVARDGQYMRVPMMLADSALVADYKDGKRQLSNGYDCELDWTGGTTPEGEVYDAEQRNIRGNHVAVVDAARGGSKLIIGDHKLENDTMTTAATATTSITIDGVGLLLDTLSASVVNAHLARMQKNMESLQAKVDENEKAAKTSKDALDAAIATHATAIATKDAEIATAKAQFADAAMTPAKLDAMIADRLKVAGVAKAVLGDKLVIDGKSVLEIKKQVVDAKLGEQAKSWNEVQVDASFAALTADVKPDQQAATFDTSGNRPNNGGPSLSDVARAFASPSGSQDVVDQAYAKRDEYLRDAWKNPTTKVA